MQRHAGSADMMEDQTDSPCELSGDTLQAVSEFLPLEDVLQCRTVCRAWASLLSGCVRQVEVRCRSDMGACRQALARKLRLFTGVRAVRLRLPRVVRRSINSSSPATGVYQQQQRSQQHPHQQQQASGATGNISSASGGGGGSTSGGTSAPTAPPPRAPEDCLGLLIAAGSQAATLTSLDIIAPAWAPHNSCPLPPGRMDATLLSQAFLPRLQALSLQGLLAASAYDALYGQLQAGALACLTSLSVRLGEPFPTGIASLGVTCGRGGEGIAAARMQRSAAAAATAEAARRALQPSGLRAITAQLHELRVLTLPLVICQDDELGDWCAALAELTQLTRLSSLEFEHPLCNTTHMAAAVASWSGMTGLRRLCLSIAECGHAHPDLDDAMWAQGQEEWGAGVWAGTFSHLTSLTHLQLTTGELPQALWDGLRACTWLRSLHLHVTGHGLDFTPAPPGKLLQLTALTDLALTLGDADLSCLCTPTLCTALTRLCLDLRGLSYDSGNGDDPDLFNHDHLLDSGPGLSRQHEPLGQMEFGEGGGACSEARAAVDRGVADRGGLAALAPLRALREFACCSSSLALTEQALQVLGRGWSQLESFEFKGPIALSDGRGLAGFARLRHLSLNRPAPGTSTRQAGQCVLHATFLPPSMTSLDLTNMHLEAAEACGFRLVSLTLTGCQLSGLEHLLQGGLLTRLCVASPRNPPQMQLARVLKACPGLETLEVSSCPGSKLGIYSDEDLLGLLSTVGPQLQLLSIGMYNASKDCMTDSLARLTALRKLVLETDSMSFPVGALTQMTWLCELSVQVSGAFTNSFGRAMVREQLNAALDAGLPDCQVVCRLSA